MLQTTPAFTDIRAGQLGTGVDVVQYQRIRDGFIDLQLRAQTMRQGSAQAQQSGLWQVEQTLNEPSDNGLSALLGKYWAAWQNVANKPDDLATRQALAQSAASLADGINTLSTQLTTIQAQTAQNETLTVSQVNSIGPQIASLNAVDPGGRARGPAAERPARPARHPDRQALVAREHDLAQTPALRHARLGRRHLRRREPRRREHREHGHAAAHEPHLGPARRHGPVISLISDPTTGYMAKLNALAAALASATNTQSALGKDLNGNAGGAFFTVTSGTEAATIAVNPRSSPRPP